MKPRLLFLAAATGSGVQALQMAFGIHDDLLAHPQYDIVISNDFVGDDEAHARLRGSWAPDSDGDAKGAPEADKKKSKELGLTLTYERMVLQKRPYLCAIPQPNGTSHSAAGATSAPAASSSAPTAEELKQEQEEREAAEKRELARATVRGWELLRELEGKCLYYQTGWWSYSFCYGLEVRQFHPRMPAQGQPPVYPPVEDPSTPAFVLGLFEEGDMRGQVKELGAQEDGGATDQKVLKDEAKGADGSGDKASTDIAAHHPPSSLSLETKGGRRYLVQRLQHGTECDLTGRPRRIDVQFHCHPQSGDRIGWIKESATCNYLMVIYTPRLCDDQAFKPLKVVCREIVEAESLESRRRDLAKKELDGAFKSAQEKEGSGKQPKKQYVGGIELGGMKIVGQDGTGKIPIPKPARENKNAQQQAEYQKQQQQQEAQQKQQQDQAKQQQQQQEQQQQQQQQQKQQQPPKQDPTLPPPSASTVTIAAYHPRKHGGRLRRAPADDLRQVGIEPEHAAGTVEQMRNSAVFLGEVNAEKGRAAGQAQGELKEGSRQVEVQARRRTPWRVEAEIYNAGNYELVVVFEAIEEGDAEEEDAAAKAWAEGEDKLPEVEMVDLGELNGWEVPWRLDDEGSQEEYIVKDEL